MQTSHRKKAFSDPQSLAATPEVAASLVAKLQKSPLEVDQRLNKLEAVFAESRIFLSNNTLLPSTLTPSDADSSAAKATVQVLDKDFGAGLDFLLTWKLWLQAKEYQNQISQLSYLAIV